MANSSSIGEESTHSLSQGKDVSFRVVWKKKYYDVTFPLDDIALKLKEHIQVLTGIPPPMMKLMYRGLVKDECTLRDLKVTPGAKMMVIGSTINDVITVQAPTGSSIDDDMTISEPKELLCEQKDHKKVIDRGKPEDVPLGIKDCQEALPDQPLSGMINKSGLKVRLHFRLEQEQLWIGTKERTEKVPLGSIRNIISEPIKGHEEYHIMAFQLGSTNLSRYWLYWVPAQYVEAIKDIILGKWQYF